MNKQLLYAIIAAMMCAALAHLCCTADHAGGSEIGNPNVVVGMVTDSAGNGVPDVAVYLVDPLERQPQHLVPDSCYRGYSDNNGRYGITGIYSGEYNLIGIDSSGAAMFLRTVVISRPYDSESDTVPCGSDILTAAAKVIVAVADCSAESNAVLFVPGTILRVDVDTCGEYLVRCPASTIDIVLARGDSSAVLADNITVEAGQWLDLTGKSYQVPVPQFESGLISGFTGRVYSFSAGGVTLGPDHPVQYRFDWGNAVSQWGLSRQSTHYWDVPGMYPVRVQARSVRDTLSVSAWSAAVDVTIQ
jgi:hypothetical protein